MAVTGSGNLFLLDFLVRFDFRSNFMAGAGFFSFGFNRDPTTIRRNLPGYCGVRNTPDYRYHYRISPVLDRVYCGLSPE